MYCSNCGLNISDKKIHKALDNDAKNSTNINYLASSLIATKKFKYKQDLLTLKENNEIDFSEEKSKLLDKLNEEISYINEKKKNNDLKYFQDILHVSEKRTLNTHDYFVCPRCGKLVRSNLDESDIKSLARAGHSEIHRGRNNISSGMCSLMIGAILAIIGLMFFALSFKATNAGVLDTTCVEFYVFIVLLVIGIGLIIYGFINLIYGKNKIHVYEKLLRSINNGVFHQ